MRTTSSRDDHPARQGRREAAERNDALKRREQPDAPPFRLVTVRGSRPGSGIDLDCPRSLDIEEDERTFSRVRR